MMKEIIEQNKFYVKICRLKSDIKSEEEQKRDLETQFRKLQEECWEVTSRILTLTWKIKKAEIVFLCEKKKQQGFENMMDEARKKTLIQKESPPDDQKELLEKEKASLIAKLQELKELNDPILEKINESSFELP